MRIRDLAFSMAFCIAAVFAGIHLFAELILRPALENDPVYSIRPIVEHCFPWNSAAQDELREQQRRNIRQVGFRNPPRASISTENVAGDSWEAHFNYEGARIDAGDNKNDSVSHHKIHIYGDSFAVAADVNYVDAWYSRLNLSEQVANFGIFGGAPDQALLYLKYNIGRGIRPRIVILTMIPENVNRLLNIYHCYLYPTSGMRSVTKPRYVVSGSGVDVERIPRPDQTDWAEVLEADFWGRRAKLIERIINNNSNICVVALFIENLQLLKNPHDYILSQPETLKIIDHILHEYAGIATTNGFVPFFLLMPTTGSEIRAYDAGESVRRFVDQARALSDGADVRFINGFKAMSTRFGKGRHGLYNVMPDGGHMSLDANEALGQYVTSAILEEIERRARSAATSR